jgi:hypothetical protein
MIGGMTKLPTTVPRTNTVPFAPKLSALAQTVKLLAASSDNIKWSDHALERMEERGITDVMVMNVLRLGEPIGLIEAGKNTGEWKIKIVRAVKGRREAGVVVLTVNNTHLLVKTVEWEDLI